MISCFLFKAETRPLFLLIKRRQIKKNKEEIGRTSNSSDSFVLKGGVSALYYINGSLEERTKLKTDIILYRTDLPTVGRDI